MNLAESFTSPDVMIFSTEQVRAARAAAQPLQRRMVDVLEEQSGLDGELFMLTLANTMHYALLGMDDLHRLAPAFDVLPFAEALEHECIALRADDGSLLLVMSDPFDLALQGWAEQRIAADFSWVLARHGDVAAYLARHEETLHAMDGLLPEVDKADATGAASDELSFRTINENTSPVVKLVH